MYKRILLLIVFFLCSGLIFAQTSNVTRAPKYLQQKEETVKLGNFPFYKNGQIPVPFFLVPTGAIPGMIGFSDYATNGNTLNQIVVRGDTVVVAMVYVDSAEATNANGGTSVRIAYNYSVTAGSTWESTSRFDLTSVKSRWPDLFYLNTVAGSTIGSSGRIWSAPTLRAGGVGIDVVLGAATGTVYILPGTGQAGNTDYFVDQMNNNQVAGVWQRNDTIYSQGFNTSTNTFGSRVFMYRTANSNTVASYDVYSSSNGTTLACFYNFVNESVANGGEGNPVFRYQKSTDNGTTWSSPVKILSNYMIGGDSAESYWHQDAAFKPGTQDPYLVFTTVPPVQYGNWEPGSESLLDSNRKGYNIVIWSPNLNSGNPVRVASYQNIDVLSDTAKFKKVTRLRTIGGTLRFGYQVNASVVSHPSIGFSNDGSVIHVAFEVARPDTSAEGFNFFDIFTTRSTDGGLTWSAPANYTNTAAEDEMYPSVSKSGNSNTGCRFTFQSTSAPGCQGFGVNNVIESQVIAPVYQIFGSTVIGIINIGTEVPSGYKLEQNYPNPFNPETNIRFSIPKSSNVTVQVFDITGRLVSTLAKDELVTAGVKEVRFNASNLASGIYFYTLKAGSFTETKKMILVK